MSDRLTFVDYLQRVKGGLETWKEKPHNTKWWKRIDGTPIPNDLCVCIAEHLAEAALAQGSAGAREERDIQHGANKRRILDRRSDSFICYTYGWLDGEAAAARGDGSPAEPEPDLLIYMRGDKLLDLTPEEYANPLYGKCWDTARYIILNLAAKTHDLKRDRANLVFLTRQIAEEVKRALAAAHPAQAKESHD